MGVKAWKQDFQSKETTMQKNRTKKGVTNGHLELKVYVVFDFDTECARRKDSPRTNKH